MVTIAVDAMGGDDAPKAEVEGAIRAVRSLDVKVILVGKQDIVHAELRKHEEVAHLPIQVKHASERVTMDDGVAAVRQKRDSSIRVAARLVDDGVADGFVSAGNTGAVMATAKFVQGMLPGVDRPAMAAAFPTLKGTPVIVVDVGANVDCSPRMLAQFAVMGDIYSRVIFHTERPRVGLLSIGEEEHKGNELTRAATPLLKALPIHFIGNVEGRDIYAGETDVIVCDGFKGAGGVEVGAERADVDPNVRGGVHAVHVAQRADRVRGGGDRGHVRPGSDDVARRGHRDQPGALGQQLAVLAGGQLGGGDVHLGPAHRGVAPGGGLHPGPDVRVVVEPGHDHLVARRPVPRQGVGEPVGERGHVRPEDHAIRVTAGQVRDGTPALGHDGAGPVASREGAARVADPGPV